MIRMTKLFAIILAGLYLVLSANVSINLHYCCDTLVDVSFYTDSCNGAMDCCGPKESELPGLSKTSCCSSEHLAIVSEDHVNGKAVSEISSSFFPILFCLDYGFGATDVENEGVIDARAGPPGTGEPLYLIHSSFLHYG